MSGGKMVRVKVPSTWRDGRVDLGREHFGVAEFNLGEGPCGKTVIALDGYFDESGYRLQQMHSDGTYKIFFYPARTLIGRVEEEYETAMGTIQRVA